MGTTRSRRSRNRTMVNGISEIDYLYFTEGDFFEAEGYEDGKTEDELRAFWGNHREAILARWNQEKHHTLPYGVERWG